MSLNCTRVARHSLMGIWLLGGMAFAQQGTSALPQSNFSPTTIGSAVLTLEKTVGDELFLSLVNTGAIPIEAWEWSAVFKTAFGEERTFRRKTETYKFAYLTAAPRPGEGPIKAGERRQIRQRLSDLTSVIRTGLDVILFSTTAWEGSEEKAGAILRSREIDAEEAELWVRALNEAMARTVPAAKQHLLARIAETTSGNESGTRQEIHRMMTTLAAKADAEFTAMASGLRDHLLKRRDVALRHKQVRHPG